MDDWLQKQKEIWDDQLFIACNKYEIGQWSKPTFERAKRRIQNKLASIDAEIKKQTLAGAER